MVMSCQARSPWPVPSLLRMAFEVTFQRLAKGVGLWTRWMWGESGFTFKPQAS